MTLLEEISGLLAGGGVAEPALEAERIVDAAGAAPAQARAMAQRRIGSVKVPKSSAWSWYQASRAAGLLRIGPGSCGMTTPIIPATPAVPTRKRANFTFVRSCQAQRSGSKPPGRMDCVVAGALAAI